MADLPPALLAYFTSDHDADVDSLRTFFTEDAHVHDEHHDHQGIDAIRAWRLDTYAKTPFSTRPLAAQVQNGALVVPVEVSGAFPNSPVILDHRFTIVDGRIASLDIR